MKGEWICSRCGFKANGEEQEIIIKVIDHEAEYHPETLKNMLKALSEATSFQMNYPINASPN